MQEYNDTQPASNLPFAPAAGETPRAFNAFMTWFQLGHARSHQAVADQLGEGLATVKNWASKYCWSERLNRYGSGLLQRQAASAAQLQQDITADWAHRLHQFREQEWDAAQKLLAAARCFLESYGDAALEKMTLAEVSRALTISSRLARVAITDPELAASQASSLSPVQLQMLEAAQRLYSQPPAEAAPVPPAPVSMPMPG
jgi:hypothetical protein